MLGISLASFKNLEAEFPFNRKLVGHSVRFRNTDIIRYIVANDEATQVE